MRHPYKTAGLWTGALLALWLLAVPASAQTRSPELNVQFHRAETAWRSGASMLEAKARVDRVLKVLPNDAEALKLRAQVLIELDRPADALVDAQRTVALKPKDGEAHLILCEAARLSGDRALAERALDEAAGLVFDSATLHVRLAWNAVQLGQLDKAEAFARTALALDDRDPAAYYQLARVFVLVEQSEDAALILRRGFELAVLDAETVSTDSVLARVADHPQLRPYLLR